MRALIRASRAAQRHCTSSAAPSCIHTLKPNHWTRSSSYHTNIPTFSSSSSRAASSLSNPRLNNDSPSSSSSHSQHDTSSMRDSSIDVVFSSPIGKMSNRAFLNARNLFYENAKKKTKEGAYNAEQILERMVAEIIDGRNHNSFVKTSMYNTVIDSWGKSKCPEGPKRALDILHRMEERAAMNNNNNNNQQIQSYSGEDQPVPDIVSYNSVLHTCSESEDTEMAIATVEQLVNRLEANIQANNDLLSQGRRDLLLPVPNTQTYNILINAYANQFGQYFYAQKAEDVLLKMSKGYADESDPLQNINVFPDVYSFNTVLKSWRNSGGGIENAKRARDILHLMKKLYEKGHDLKPDSISYTTVLHAFADHYTGNSENDIDAIDQMQEVAEDVIQSDFFKDDKGGNVLRIFNSAISCFSRNKLPDADKRAEKLFEMMKKAKEDGRINDSPDEISYSVLLRCIAGTSATSPRFHGKVNQILKDVIDGTLDIKPNASLFNGIMTIYAKRKYQESQVEHVYQCMKDYVTRNDLGYAFFDMSTFNVLANMYFRSDDKVRAMKKALDLIEDLEKAIEDGMVPDEQFVYNVVIHMLRKSRRKDAGDKAYKLLMRMEELYDSGYPVFRPDGICYNMVIAANTSSESSNPERVQELIDRMLENGKDSNDYSPDAFSYVHQMTGLQRSKSKGDLAKIPGVLKKLHKVAEQNPVVKVNTRIYEIVLRLLLNDSALAQEAFDTMSRHYGDGENTVKPSPMTCNLLLKAMCKKSPSEAHSRLLKFINDYNRRAIDYSPDVVGINTVLGALSKEKTLASIAKMDQLFSTMKYLGDQNKTDVPFAPDSVTYAIMLKTMEKRQIVKIEKALEWFSNIESSMQDTYNYNVLMNALARSNAKDKVTQARRLLNESIDRGMSDLGTYQRFLNACAYEKSRNPSVREKSMNQAMEVFSDLKSHSSLQPNEKSFYTLIQIVRHLAKDESERDERIKDIFLECIDVGLLSKYVVQLLRSFLSTSKRSELFGNNLEGDINDQWSRNTR